MIHLKTRHIFRTIESRISWDSRFNITQHPETMKEIIFWKNNIKNFKKRVIIEYCVPSVITYSDASNTGLASVFKEKGKNVVCYKNFSENEMTMSST